MQDLRWYLNRLGRMSAAEILHRSATVGRGLLARSGLSRPPTVPEYRDAAPAPFVCCPAGISADVYVLAAERILADRYKVFDLSEVALGNPPAWNRDPLTGKVAPLLHSSALDYRDERLVGNIKYLWEPSRHLHLVTLAQAFALTGDVRYAATLKLHLQSWFEQNPYGRGVHWTSSLELGIRLINWSICWQLIGGHGSVLFQGGEGGAFRHAWLRAIYLHAHGIMGHLSRFSSANNHLIGEAAGVAVAAATWPHWGAMDRWGGRARQILEEQCLLQNAPDGGNREQAFSYQQFVLDFLLVAGLAGRATGSEFSEAYWGRLEQMVGFIASMTDVGGNLAMIGDADDGFVVNLVPVEQFDRFKSLTATGAVLFNRADLATKARAIDEKTLWLLGDEAGRKFESLLSAGVRFVPQRAFADTGYYILGSSLETRDELRMMIDCGPLGYLSLAAHGHADALSLVLSAGGEEVLIDPGTYSYHTEPEWRRYFRSTRAHNTLEVDGEDQAVQQGNFMWSRHQKAVCADFDPGGDEQRFAGTHDGYERLADPVQVRRSVRFIERLGKFVIEDDIRCSGEHRVALHWHFSERLVPVVDNGCVTVSAGGYTIRIRSEHQPGESAVFQAGSSSEGGWVSRSFGQKVPCTTVRWMRAVSGSTRIRTIIECSRSGPAD